MPVVVPELMQRADILLMPSIEAGFGLDCAEAIGAVRDSSESMPATEADHRLLVK
jgi:hypothetical protein